MSGVSSERVYGGQPLSARVQQRRERLLEAARTVIRRDGIRQTTFRAVREESGLTARYFYESFDNLEALLVDLMTELLETTQVRVVDAVLAAPPTDADRVRAAIGSFVDVVDADPVAVELGFTDVPEHPRLEALRRNGLETFTALVLEQASLLAPDLLSGVGRQRAQHAATMVIGGFFEVLRRRASGSLELSRDDVVDHTADLFLAIAAHLTGP